MTQLAISMPWSPVNRFTVLTVEATPNTIDSDPIDALSTPLTPLVLLYKGIALFPPQNCITMLRSDLILFKYY